jgi:hypothetical protein
MTAEITSHHGRTDRRDRQEKMGKHIKRAPALSGERHTS